MSHPRSYEHGFSTVELLISLFIAAAFIVTGFQLFSIITKDSGEARMRAVALNVANDELQRLRDTGGYIACPSSSTVTNPLTTLPQATIKTDMVCPYENSSSIRRITVTVAYGSPQKEVKAALDVIRTGP